MPYHLTIGESHTFATVAELKAFVAALPDDSPPPPADPIDCVWSPWSAWATWSAWLPLGDGNERRTRTRTRTVAVEAAHGGAPCVGETVETEQETQPIPVAPVDCVWGPWSAWSGWSAWIAVGDGTERRTMSRSRVIATQEAAGGAPCDGDLLEVESETRPVVVIVTPEGTMPIPWPAAGQLAWQTTLPTTAPSGWRTGEDFVDVNGQPEPRVVRSAIWCDSEVGNLDQMRGIMLDIPFPRIARGDSLYLPARVCNLRWGGGTFDSLNKVVGRSFGINWMAPSPLRPADSQWRGNYRKLIPLTASALATFVPILIDLRTAPDTPGWAKFEFDLQCLRPDGKTANARFTSVWIWIDKHNTGANPPTMADNVIATEGWVSSTDAASVGSMFGYMGLTVWGMRWFESDPVRPIKVLVSQGTAGRHLELRVMKNANLYKSPVIDYGELLPITGLNKTETIFTFTMPTSSFKFADAFTVQPPPLVPGDVLMWRIADAFDPTIGAGSTIGRVRLSEG